MPDKPLSARPHKARPDTDGEAEKLIRQHRQYRCTSPAFLDGASRSQARVHAPPRGHRQADDVSSGTITFTFSYDNMLSFCVVHIA